MQHICSSKLAGLLQTFFFSKIFDPSFTTASCLLNSKTESSSSYQVSSWSNPQPGVKRKTNCFIPLLLPSEVLNRFLAWHSHSLDPSEQLQKLFNHFLPFHPTLHQGFDILSIPFSEHSLKRERKEICRGSDSTFNPIFQAPAWRLLEENRRQTRHSFQISDENKLSGQMDRLKFEYFTDTTSLSSTSTLCRPFHKVQIGSQVAYRAGSLPPPP